MEHRIEPWGRERAPELAALVAAAMADEELSEDELLACCWDDPAPLPARGGSEGDGKEEAGVVLATGDGRGAIAVVWRPPASGAARPGAYVKLLVVAPGAQRAGRGDALLGAAEAWAWAHGADELRLDGTPPFDLWPGVDATALAALCLAEARGYRRIGSGLNLWLPSIFRAPTPEGVAIRRVIEDDDVALVDRLIGACWPEWRDETWRAIEHACCHAAFVVGGARAVGFACHSVSRAGWLGPMGTDPQARGSGVGRALVGAVCSDLMIAEMKRVEICWAGPLRFYASCGAEVSRTFLQYSKPRP
jgi:GNAT superfamily N-acetyltransferase